MAIKIELKLFMVNFADELSEDSVIHCMQNEAWNSAIFKYFWKDFYIY